MWIKGGGLSEVCDATFFKAVEVQTYFLMKQHFVQS